MIPIREALETGKLLLSDGAMGTQLAARGGIQGPMSNLKFPELVKDVHADYKNAGADIVLTNTLTANRMYLEHARSGDDFEEINIRGVQLCREAVGDGCYVCGDMTSAGQFMEPLGDYTEQQFHDNAAEQAALLARNGVDLIIIETMTDVREMCVAVRAAREVASVPVIASVAFDAVADGFRTMMGDTVEKAVRDLTDAGADVIGANCGTIGPMEMSRVIGEMRKLTEGVLIAQPNAGKPELAAGQVTFNLSPAEFVDGMVKCIEAGATLVGGCCGTTPEHITELAKRVK